MTTPRNRNWLYRCLVAEGYVDAEPSRRRLEELVADKITVYKVSKVTGIATAVLYRIHNGESTLVHPGNAETLKNVTAEEIRAAFARPEPFADDVAVERILGGIPVDVPSADKPAYAKELYALGWNKNQIALRLGMSWSRIRESIGEAA